MKKNNEVQISNQQKTSLSITNTLISQAKDLAAEHELFNEQYVISGRKALYGLLAKIYALVERFDQSIDKADLIKMMRKNLHEQYGIKTQDNTSATTVLVRYITRADRKTAHVYARAIESAQENCIKAEDFAAYVERSGGVERIRAIGASADAADVKQALEEEMLALTHAFLGARTEMPFAEFDAPKAFDGIYSKSCTYELVICSLGTSGKYNVIGKLPADLPLENLAIKYFAKYLCKDIEKAREGVATVANAAQKKRQERLDKDQARQAEHLAGVVH